MDATLLYSLGNSVGASLINTGTVGAGVSSISEGTDYYSVYEPGALYSISENWLMIPPFVDNYLIANYHILLGRLVVFLIIFIVIYMYRHIIPWNTLSLRVKPIYPLAYIYLDILNFIRSFFIEKGNYLFIIGLIWVFQFILYRYGQVPFNIHLLSWSYLIIGAYCISIDRTAGLFAEIALDNPCHPFVTGYKTHLLNGAIHHIIIKRHFFKYVSRAATLASTKLTSAGKTAVALGGITSVTALGAAAITAYGTIEAARINADALDRVSERAERTAERIEKLKNDTARLEALKAWYRCKINCGPRP